MNELSEMFLHRALWERKDPIFPKRSCVSGAWLWLWFKSPWVGTVVWTGPGDAIIDHCWMSEQEYLMLALQGKVR